MAAWMSEGRFGNETENNSIKFSMIVSLYTQVNALRSSKILVIPAGSRSKVEQRTMLCMAVQAEGESETKVTVGRGRELRTT